NPGRSLEAKVGRGLQNQGAGKILRRKTPVEGAQNDFVYVFRINSGIGEGINNPPPNGALNGFFIRFPEGGWGPTDKEGGHLCLLCRTLVVFPRQWLASHHNIRWWITGFAYHPKLR